MLVTYIGNYNTSLSTYTTNQCNLYNTSLVTYIGNYNTNTTNISCVNSSFAFCNISTLTCKNGNIINISSTNCSFQIQNVSYSTIFNLSCLSLNVSNISCLSISCTNISCTNLYNNINSSIIAQLQCTYIIVHLLPILAITILAYQLIQQTSVQVITQV